MNVNHRGIRIDLAGYGGNHAKSNGITQPFRAAEGKDEFALTDVAVQPQRECGELHIVDLQEGEVDIAGDAHNASGDDVSARG